VRRFAPSREGLLIWSALGVMYALIAAAAIRSPLAAVILAGGLGILALLAVLLTRRGGFLAVMAALLVITLVLPGNMALAYRVPVGGGGIFIIDVLLGVLVAGALAAFLAQGRLSVPRCPATPALAAFMAWMVAAAALGLVRGMDLKFVLADVRALSYYLLYFVILVSVRDRRAVVFLLKVLAVCLVADFAVGAFYYAIGQGSATEFVEAGISRFPAPHDIFLGAMLLLATWVIVWPAGRPRPRILWILMAVALTGLMLSLVRGYWVALVVGLAYLFVSTRTSQRVRLVMGTILIAVLFASVTAAVNFALLQSVVTRAVAITAFQDQNVQFRLIENHAAWLQVRERPLVGQGLGTPYLFDRSRYGVAPELRFYIHNNYIWFLQRMGVVGLGLFAWFIVAFLVTTRRLPPGAEDADPWLSGLVRGARVMIVGLLVASITSPQFNTKENVAAIATVVGLAVVARSLLARGSEEDDADGQEGSTGPRTRASGALNARSSE
jgi:O-Antigen ligase